MEIRKSIVKIIDDTFDEIWEISKEIYNHPETAFEEKYAKETLVSKLSQYGFYSRNDQTSILPTSFKMTYCKGNGPRIAVLAEYDALPEIGHACGHNLICTNALLTAIAVKKTMENFNIEGSIEVYGTPAEENGGGKIILLKNGAFDGLDAVFLMHPTSAKTRIGGECISFTGKYITFTGKAAHAESHPEEGVNAMDAMTLFHQAVGVSRQQLPDDLHICDVVTKISDDIGQIPSYAKIEVELSSMNSKHIALGDRVIERIAKGIAIATNCNVKIEEIPGYLGRIPNQVLGDICRGELIALGEPVMEGMPPDKGGEDLGDVSRIIPSCNIFGTIYPNKKISGHTILFKEAAISEEAKHCLNITSKAMALTIIKLFQEPVLLEKAKKELKERLNYIQ